MYRYGNKQSCPQPDQCEKMEVMWADESVYGPPAPGSKVGDFIQTWLMGSWDCGVFTHREIAQRLMDTFTGLKLKELAWFENPREKTLKTESPVYAGSSGCRSGRWIWCISTPTTIVTQEIRFPLKPTFHGHKVGRLGRKHLVHVYPGGRREADCHGLRQSGRRGDHYCGIGVIQHDWNR